MSCATDQREFSSSFEPSHDEETLPPLRADGPSVWVGFIEDLPVIGTVKEAVEWVLAVYEGNQSVMKLKEEAIKTSLCAPPQDSLQEPMRMLAIPEKTQTSAASEGQTGSAGLQDITEVRLGYIAEYIQNAMKGKKGQQTYKLTKPEDKVETLTNIRDKVKEIIRFIKPEFDFTEPLMEEIKRSKQGEHVFNKNILIFHRKILKDFFYINQHTFSDTLIKELANHGLNKTTVCEISTNMVVHFDEEEFYVNSNAMVYGRCCEKLHKVLVDMLNTKIEIDGNDPNVNYINQVNSITKHMNDNEVYVDHFAKEKWIDQDRSNELEPSRMKRFELVKGDVADMYNNRCGVKWCAEIKNILSKLPKSADAVGQSKFEHGPHVGHPRSNHSRKEEDI
ncbi:uncharacterized protein LOC143497204 isoform X2 [Brachyhypopomus gauderio]|uniref:uncharacterized protein LOC143497204 isoform X2 n=1 Tax=Brachyhypopomus gauderio TaxID=698409 RepID=UPI00404173AE